MAAPRPSPPSRIDDVDASAERLGARCQGATRDPGIDRPPQPGTHGSHQRIRWNS